MNLGENDPEYQNKASLIPCERDQESRSRWLLSKVIGLSSCVKKIVGPGVGFNWTSWCDSLVSWMLAMADLTAQVVAEATKDQRSSFIGLRWRVIRRRTAWQAKVKSSAYAVECLRECKLEAASLECAWLVSCAAAVRNRSGDERDGRTLWELR